MNGSCGFLFFLKIIREENNLKNCIMLGENINEEFFAKTIKIGKIGKRK